MSPDSEGDFQARTPAFATVPCGCGLLRPESAGLGRGPVGGGSRWRLFRGFRQTCSDLSIFTVSHRMLSPPRKLCSTWSPPPFHTCEPLTSALPPPEGRVAGTAFSDGLLPLRDARVRSLHVSSRRDGSRAPPSGATAVH